MNDPNGKEERKMNDKKTSVIYVTYLYLEGHDVVDFDETRIYLNALKCFDIMEKEAIEEVFGEGDYQVLLVKEFINEKGQCVKSECLKKVQIKQGDEI